MGKVYLPPRNGLCWQEGFEPNLGEVWPSAGSVGPRSGSAITPSHREPSRPVLVALVVLDVIVTAN
jgi:hypothetical protein